jgi:hypothetical protein
MASMRERCVASLNLDRDHDDDGTHTYQDEDMELSLLSRNDPQKHRHWLPLHASQPDSGTLSKKSQLWVYGQMAAFYLAGSSTFSPFYE